MACYESYFDENGELITISDDIEMRHVDSALTIYEFPRFENARECVAAYMDGRITEEEFEHEMQFFEAE